ncbi:MAG TPA: hypothetical protein VE223_01240, partial [Nitrososphaeraceae archaeon]|nr:hypothetical protein [Nitrososphaeraceae archaeon]
MNFEKLKKIKRIQERGEDGVTYSASEGKDNNNNDGDDKNTENSNKTRPRLILACVDLQKGEPVVFDSIDTDIDIENVIACTGYATYGLPWTKKDGRYLWDGSLRHNTPLKAVVSASPKREKRLYMCDVFPSKQEKLPANMLETLHRVRDLLFMDKSIEELKVRSDLTKKHLKFIEKMYDVMMRNNISKIEKNAASKSRFKELEQEYNSIIQERGTIIDKLLLAQRKEKPGHRFLFEDADFS